MTRLEFSQLPLIETAVRFTLAEPAPLTYATVFGIKEQLGEIFTTLEDSNQIEGAPGQAGPPDISISGPNVAVFAGNKNGLRLRLQYNLVSVRWQWAVDPESPRYPRYPAMRDLLSRSWSALGQAGGSKDAPKISVVNMFYINYIPQMDSEDVLVNYIQECARPAILSEAQRVQKLEASWQEVGGIDLRFCLEHATARLRTDGEDVIGYKFTTAAGKKLDAPTGPADALDALDGCHERMQDFFLQLISKSAKESWGYTE